MKKLYEKPQTTVLESLTDAELLLAASGRNTTNNAFSRRHRRNDRDNEDEWDDEAWAQNEPDGVLE